MDIQELFGLIREGVEKKDAASVKGYLSELKTRRAELGMLRTPAASEELGRIEAFLISPTKPVPKIEPVIRIPKEPTVENSSSKTTTVLIQKPQLPKRPLSEIQRDPDQPAQNWDVNIEYPIIMMRCEQGLENSFPHWNEMMSLQIRGGRAQGKSSLEECIGICYWQNNGNLWDIFSSHLEATSWLDAPNAIRESVRFIIPESTTIECPFDIKTIFLEDVLSIASGNVVEHKKIFVLIRRFFGSDALYFDALKRLSDAFGLRDSWESVDCVIVREAGSWLSSRMKTGKNRQQAEEDFRDFHNQLLHSGYACLLDALRQVSISKELRDVLSGVVLKAQGSQVLERERRFLYRIYTADFVRNVPFQNFILHLQNDAVFTCWFLAPPFWHELRGKNILKRIGIKIHFDMKLLKSLESKALHSSSDHLKIVTPEMHEQIVRLKLKGTAQKTIAAAMQVSETTVKTQLRLHRVAGSNDECSIEEGKGIEEIDMGLEDEES